MAQNDLEIFSSDQQQIVEQKRASTQLCNQTDQREQTFRDCEIGQAQDKQENVNSDDRPKKTILVRVNSASKESVEGGIDMQTQEGLGYSLIKETDRVNNNNDFSV